MAKPSSTHRVARYLEKQIRTSCLGDSLPSVRQVMKTCRVSPQTVAAAVSELERANWLEVRPQSGLYRAGSADAGPAIDTIEVLYFNVNDHLRRMILDQTPVDTSFHGDLLGALGRAGAARKTTLRLHVPEPGESDADMTHRIADDPEVRACLIISLVDSTLVEILNTAQVVYTNLFPAGFILPPNAVVNQADDVVGQQIEALVAQGHTHIGYMHTVEDDHYHRDSLLRRESFYRLAIKFGLSVRPDYVTFGGFAGETVRRAATKLLSHEKRPTGLICSDAHLPYIYETAKSLGLRIPRDLSVVGTDDLVEASDVDPPASTVRVPRLASIEKALDLLMEVAHGRTLRTDQPLTTDVRLISRRSISLARDV